MTDTSSRAFQKFLLKKGVIREKDLQDIKALKDDVNISLGIIAMNHGLLTPEEVAKIASVQKKTKKKFGQIAVQLKLLNRNQLRAILVEQTRVNLDVGEMLVLAGRLSFEQLENERRAFTRQKL